MIESEVLEKVIEHFFVKRPTPPLYKQLGFKNRESFAQDTLYNKITTLVSDIKQISDKYTASRDQVYHCLKLIREAKSEKNLAKCNTLNRIIRKSLYNNWDPEDKETYDKVFILLTRWKDFFFSYTTRKSYKLNKEFKGLICRDFSPEEVNSSIDKTNFLAKLIVSCLQENGLTAFYDKNDIKCGDDIGNEILEHCCSSFAFVQLVEPISFIQPDEGKENWCHREFNEFKASKVIDDFCQTIKAPRFFFCLYDKLDKVKPVGGELPASYKEWYDKASSLHYITLIGYMGDRISATKSYNLRMEIRGLAEKISASKNSIIDNVMDYLKQQTSSTSA
ncbi:MAG: hypothetical protein N3B21_05765 [Clostridia bacterium]|nr:hypothetical protein [Clostridia bacterium]